MANSDERAARLAAQLRANLHRRKAQARAVAAGPGAAAMAAADRAAADAGTADTGAVAGGDTPAPAAPDRRD